MSNLQADPEVGRDGPSSPTELLEGATVALGGPRGMAVTRTLPNKRRRMVGAWCFLDAYGPDQLAGTPGMRVGPHPHIGLQTVSWLVAGEILHRDSLGNRQQIRPGQLNLMTAGRGISHSEETPAQHSGVLQGVQLWVALPNADRDLPPAFAHHADLPMFTDGGLTATVLMGELGGAASPAKCYTPLVGAEISLAAGSDEQVPLRADFEYAVLMLDGAATVDGAPLKPGPLLYLGDGRTSLRLCQPAAENPEQKLNQPAAENPEQELNQPAAENPEQEMTSGSDARLILIGGEPFAERLVMWWNFVARDHDEIVQARAEWESGSGFGEVQGYDGPAIPAPPMPITRLVARGRIR